VNPGESSSQSGEAPQPPRLLFDAPPRRTPSHAAQSLGSGKLAEEPTARAPLAAPAAGALPITETDQLQPPLLPQKIAAHRLQPVVTLEVVSEGAGELAPHHRTHLPDVCVRIHVDEAPGIRVRGVVVDFRLRVVARNRYHRRVAPSQPGDQLQFALASLRCSECPDEVREVGAHLSHFPAVGEQPPDAAFLHVLVEFLPIIEHVHPFLLSFSRCHAQRVPSRPCPEPQRLVAKRSLRFCPVSCIPSRTFGAADTALA